MIACIEGQPVIDKILWHLQVEGALPPPSALLPVARAEFLFGERTILPYRIIFTVLVVVGAYVPLKLVWNFADIANMLVAVPNLISLIQLVGLVKKCSDDYMENRLKN